jgi:ribosomal protein L37E
VKPKSNKDQPAFRCPHCGAVSYNPNDIREKYCANCDTFPEQRAAADELDEKLGSAFNEIDECLRQLIGANKRHHDHYRLDAKGEPMPCTFGQWAVFLDRSRERRVVRQEWVGDIHISTVFLGLDHSFGGPIPILWETMAFSNDKHIDQLCDRCGGSREQAEAMHARMVAKAEQFECGKTKKS